MHDTLVVDAVPNHVLLASSALVATFFYLLIIRWVYYKTGSPGNYPDVATHVAVVGNKYFKACVFVAVVSSTEKRVRRGRVSRSVGP